ncbi:MAG: prepilin-type N-terminal cleavage/methylation domain-containing protein, partial [Planctomycetes bacterium]|nr:prepilin-type N-terminal cleavage/methylation domain-containing protein [Planctomycetota bacterium]
MKTKKGFTLIELLVVIAIIALLLSILIPSLNRAKDAAKNLICKSNLKSLGAASLAYLGDNQGKFTSSFANIYKDGVITSGSSCQWHTKGLSPWDTPANAGPLWGYFNTPKILLCSTFVNLQKLWHYELMQQKGTPCNTPMDPQFGFSQNNFLGRPDGKGVFRITEVSNPSETLYWAEESTWPVEKPIGSGNFLNTAVLNDTNFMARHPADPTGLRGDGIATYHGIPTAIERRNDGQGDVLFLDGHVEFQKSDFYSTVGGLRFTTSYVLAWPKASS